MCSAGAGDGGRDGPGREREVLHPRRNYRAAVPGDQLQGGLCAARLVQGWRRPHPRGEKQEEVGPPAGTIAHFKLYGGRRRLGVQNN